MANIKKDKKESGKKESGNRFGSFPLTGRNVRVIVCTIVTAGIIVFSYCIWNVSLGPEKNNVKFLINSDENSLKEAFFSEHPHIFYCHEHGNPLYIPQKLVTAHKILGSEYHLGVLNCSQVLPSGKQIFDRFKIKQEWSPAIFAVAPWSGRVQVPPAKLSKDALHISNYLASALTPRERKIEKDKEFQEYCGAVALQSREDIDSEEGGRSTSGASSDMKTCLVVVKGPLYSEIQQDTVKSLVKSWGYKNSAVVSVDSKTRWISIESSSVLSSKFTMRLYAVRNGTHYLALDSAPSLETAQTFARHAVQSSLKDYISSDRIRLVKPALTSASSSSSSTSSNHKRSSSVKKRKPSDPSVKSEESETSSESNVQDAEDELQDQRRKEQIRREQMDRQSEDFIFVENSDARSSDAGNNEGSISSTGHEEYEEDYIEL